MMTFIKRYLPKSHIVKFKMSLISTRRCRLRSLLHLWRFLVKFGSHNSFEIELTVIIMILFIISCLSLDFGKEIVVKNNEALMIFVTSLIKTIRRGENGSEINTFYKQVMFFIERDIKTQFVSIVPCSCRRI